MEVLRISYNNDIFSIRYKNEYYESSLEDLEDTFSNLLKTFPRSVFLIAENSRFIINDEQRTSAFMNWNRLMTVKLEYEGIEYVYSFEPTISDRIVHVPKKFIELEITGDVENILLNGVAIDLPFKQKIPKSYITITKGNEVFDKDLTFIQESNYIINLDKQNLVRKVETKVEKVYEIKSGVYFFGSPFSIWIGKDKEPYIVKSRFYSNYGDIETRSRTFQIDGIIVFVHEINNTLYLLSSSGQFFTMGAQNINSDLGRSPLNISLYDDFIEIVTFKFEKYRINFSGGIFRQGRIFDMELKIPDYSPDKFYYIDNYVIEIKNDVVEIYEKIEVQ